MGPLCFVVNQHQNRQDLPGFSVDNPPSRQHMLSLSLSQHQHFLFQSNYGNAQSQSQNLDINQSLFHNFSHCTALDAASKCLCSVLACASATALSVISSLWDAGSKPVRSFSADIKYSSCSKHTKCQKIHQAREQLCTLKSNAICHTVAVAITQSMTPATLAAYRKQHHFNGSGTGAV